MTVQKRWSEHRYRGGARAALFLIAVFAAGLLTVHAQNGQFDYPGIVDFSRGQDVSPTFDGWERNPDGTFSMYFGYLNRNTEEDVDVPIGPENNFDLGNGDQGQPTHFYPGRRWWVFKVVVPKDWPTDKRLVWTLTNRGRTNQSKGWLEPEWEVDKALISSESGVDPFLGSANSPFDPNNTAPILTGSTAQTVTLPAAANLTVTATDDGLPKPGPAKTSGKVRAGVRIRWILYRGPGKVQFDPDLSPFIYGQPVTLQTAASFSMPGNYRLRAIATDGALATTYDVDVKVNPSTSAEKAR